MVRLSTDHLVELRRLNEELQAVLDVLMERGELPDLGARLRATVADLAVAQDLRGMRTAARDLRGMLSALELPARRELLTEAGRRTGRPITLGAGADRVKASAIVARGRIRNETEYFLLVATLDEILLDPERAGEHAAISALLQSYRT